MALKHTFFHANILNQRGLAIGSTCSLHGTETSENLAHTKHMKSSTVVQQEDSSQVNNSPDIYLTENICPYLQKNNKRLIAE